MDERGQERPRDASEAPPPWAVLGVYAPLAVSWLMMAAEAPITMALVNRLPDPVVSAAAFNPLFALALFIESPVIDLLTTSTTLARGRLSYERIRAFTVATMLWTGIVHALVALTPLYDAVMYGLLRLPPEVGEAARLPMAIMVPWSPAIGWRRHLQGVLIASGSTRAIGWGTGVRLSTIVLVGVGMFAGGHFPGVVVAASALSASVSAEAVFIHFAARRALRDLAGRDDTEAAAGLTMGALARFHLPLTAATMVLIATGPLLTAALARLPDGVLALAAWQNMVALGFLLRTVTFALPEVVIRFLTGRASEAALRRFCLSVGAAMSLSTLALCMSGLDRLFFARLQGATAEVAAAAQLALLVTVPLPFVNASAAFYRGCLTSARRTVVRLRATVVAVLATVLSLAVGSTLRWPGVVVGGVALVVGQTVEAVVLGLSWRRVRRVVPEVSSAAPTGTG